MFGDKRTGILSSKTWEQLRDRLFTLFKPCAALLHRGPVTLRHDFDHRADTEQAVLEVYNDNNEGGLSLFSKPQAEFRGHDNAQWVAPVVKIVQQPNQVNNAVAFQIVNKLGAAVFWLDWNGIHAANGYCFETDACFEGSVTIATGLTVTSGGISLPAGNITLTSGNLTLTSGNLTVGGNVTLGPGSTFCQTSGNLITNPGGETGDATGWTTVAGSPGARAADTWGSPLAGTYSLWFGASATGEMYQEIDLTQYGWMIDAGTQSASFSGYITSFDQAVDDQGRIVIEYRDSGGAVLESYDTGLVAPLTWTAYTDTRTIPATCRTVRIRLLGVRNTGTNLDAYFDSLSFSLACP